MKQPMRNAKNSLDRRFFMRSGLLAGGSATVGAGLLTNATSARAQEDHPAVLLVRAMPLFSGFWPRLN
jgi:hypothetical protein